MLASLQVSLARFRLRSARRVEVTDTMLRPRQLTDNEPFDCGPRAEAQHIIEGPNALGDYGHLGHGTWFLTH